MFIQHEAVPYLYQPTPAGAGEDERSAGKAAPVGISRLRAVALRSHQLERMIRTTTRTSDNRVSLVLMELRKLLAKEPVIQEEEAS